MNCTSQWHFHLLLYWISGSLRTQAKVMSPTVSLPASGLPSYPIKYGMNKPMQSRMAPEMCKIKLTGCVLSLVLLLPSSVWLHQQATQIFAEVFFLVMLLMNFSYWFLVTQNSVQNRARLENGGLALVYLAFLYDRFNWKSNRKLDWKIANWQLACHERSSVCLSYGTPKQLYQLSGIFFYEF